MTTSSQPQTSTQIASRFLQFLPQRLVNFALGDYDLITKAPLTKSGSTANTRIAGRYGLGSSFGDTGGVNYLSAAVRAETRNSMTMVWVGRTTSGTNGALVRDFSAAGGSIPIWNNAGVFDIRMGGSDFTGAGTFSVDTDTVIVVTTSATAVKVWANGVLVINGGAPGGTALASPWVLHRNGNNFQGVPATTRLWTVFALPFPDLLAQQVSFNPWQLFQAPVRRKFAPPAAGGDVSVALTGSAATASIGTVMPSTTVALTGSEAVAGQGDMVAEIGIVVDLTGQEMTASIGSVSPSNTVALSGSEAAASLGTMVATPTFGLSGQEATTEQGSVTQSRTVPLTGEGMTSSQGTMGIVGDVTVALTGQSMTVSLGVFGVTAATEAYSGGYAELPRMKRARSVEEERERLGIIPKKVKQIIKAVAAASVQEIKTDDQAERQLAQRLAAQDIEAQARFAEFMRAERDRLLSRDIEIALRIKAKQEANDEDEREVEMLLM